MEKEIVILSLMQFLCLLPGLKAHTPTIAVADVNGDGHIDIFLGKSGAENPVLMNNGKGDGNPFQDATIITLPGLASVRTHAIVAADINGDEHIDVIIGNYIQQNQVIFDTLCPNAGAQLHSNS